MRPRLAALAALAGALISAPPADAQRVLFDGRHGQTAGLADWIVDADGSDQVWTDFRCRRTERHHSPQRVPTPPQATIRPETPETVWTGGISAWAVALAKDALTPGRGRSWQIEQYPWDGPEFTFGDAMNPQDLGNYDVVILCEPNVVFTDAEAQAVREFVAAGGGLFLCADHETSDRNCSGGGVEVHDSPFILNRLMQTDVETRRTPPYFDPLDPDHDYGVFGIWFYENGNDDPDDAENQRFDWFDEAVNDNVVDAADDPLLHGPFGDGTGGLGLFGATQMAVSTHPERGNPTARAHIFRNGASRTVNAAGVAERVTFASARFGAGRVVAVGDSSPADDSTGQGRLHPGWDRASGGVANHVLFLNATEWLADPAPDVTPPAITSGPEASPADCAAVVSWLTDEPATSEVAWGEAPPFAERASAPGLVTGHHVRLRPLRPATRYEFRVTSADGVGNGPAESGPAAFTTGAERPLGLEEPVVEAAGPTSLTVSWRTAKPAVGRVEATAPGGGTVAALADEAAPGHALTLAGLAPATAYQVVVEATDDCGNRAAAAFAATTPPAPAEVDLSGWRLLTGNRDFAFTFPAGTSLAAGGTLVLGRANDRAGFEAEWGVLDPGVVYLDSGDSIVVNAIPRSFTLLDAQGQPVDGPTVPIVKNRSRARLDGCADAGVGAGWSDRPSTAADPGRGAPPACGAGVVLTELSDAGDFRNEFVELRFDAGP